MPSIKTKQSTISLHDKTLQNVLHTEPKRWEHNFFSQDTMENVLDKLNDQISNKNFFTEDYSINTFLTFLKTYVKLKLAYPVKPDTAIFKKIDFFLKQFKTKVIYQPAFKAQHINTVINFLEFLKVLFHSPHRFLFENEAITFNAEDLKKIATTVVNHKNDTVDGFITTYIDTLKLSFDVMPFLHDYKQAHEGIISIAKTIFLDKQATINLLIIKLFSALAYEFRLLNYYQPKLMIKNLPACQSTIIEETIGLQRYFFNKLDQREDVSLGALKYFFFRYFIEKAMISTALKNRYANRLSRYSDEHFNPLPYRYECKTISNNQFVIKHAGLDQPKLEIVCQTKVCTDRNHNEWLKRIGKDQFLPDSYYTFHIFSDERHFASDIYRYVSFEPPSTGFFTGISRNKTHAIGNAYALYKPNPTNWWQVSAHEYAHQLNYRAFDHLPRNFDEGLAYRVILDPCFDKGFQRWLTLNRNQYTSLKELLNPLFIGYNPSSLFMSYFVETRPAAFTQLLNLYQHHDRTISIQLKHVIQQENGFLQWLDAYQARCTNHNFSALGEGDHYCPPLIVDQASERLLIENTSMASVTTLTPNHSASDLTQKKLNPDAMGHDLVWAIYNRDRLKLHQLLQNGANVNYRDKHNGNTPLHYLYFYANCDTRYLEEILNYNPVVVKNNAELFPYALAEINCNSTQLQSIQVIFARYAQFNKTALVPYREHPIAITISIPLSALISGGISAGYNEIAERHNKRYPYLPSLIFYGLKPASLAIGSAVMNVLMAGSADKIGVDTIWPSFAYYLGMNYFGLIVAQFGEKAAKKIQNQCLNFLITILFYTFFLNPSLFVTLFSEGLSRQNFSGHMMPLLSLLSNGLLFKTGEWGTQKVMRKCFPVKNREHEVNTKESNFLSPLLACNVKGISEDKAALKLIQDGFNHLTIKIKKRIKNHIYKLNFDKNIESAAQNISALLEISQEEHVINQNRYRSLFKAFETDLKKIQTNLNTLSQKKGRGKNNISPLWKEMSELLTCLREIRPLPKWNASPVLFTQRRQNSTQEVHQYSFNGVNIK